MFFARVVRFRRYKTTFFVVSDDPKYIPEVFMSGYGVLFFQRYYDRSLFVEYKNTTLKFQKFQEWHEDLFVISFQETHRCLGRQTYLLVRENISHTFSHFSHKQSFLSRWSLCESNKYAISSISLFLVELSVWSIAILPGKKYMLDFLVNFPQTPNKYCYFLYYLYSTEFCN